MIINPSFLTRPRIFSDIPAIDIDFTRGLWDDRLALTRASTATYKDASGAGKTADVNIPRFEYDVNGKCLGLLMEESRTNYLYNSTAPATQSRSLIAGNYIVWIEGTGSVTLSGGATGTATAGAPARFTLASTVSVTFTVNGSVTVIQCEKSTAALEYVFPTSFIVTSSSGATRAADDVIFTSTNNFSSTEGLAIIECMLKSEIQQTMRLFQMNDGTSANIMEILYQNDPSQRAIIKNTSSTQFDVTNTVVTTPVNTIEKMALGYKQDNFVFATNGVIRGTDISGSVPSFTDVHIGGTYSGSNPFTGYIRRITYFNKRPDNETIRQLTT